MIRSLPPVATILVALSAIIMVALGFWQLGRADEKEALLARYAVAGDIAEPVPYPRTQAAATEALYRRSEVICDRVLERRATAGTSTNGARGWAQVARCALRDGGETDIAIGWTRGPEGPTWTGGEVEGIVAPGPRLVADPARAGLIPLMPPDPADTPNNHLAYAGQWFFFAITALVIYALALRRRKRDTAANGPGIALQDDLTDDED